MSGSEKKTPSLGFLDIPNQLTQRKSKFCWHISYSYGRYGSVSWPVNFAPFALAGDVIPVGE